MTSHAICLYSLMGDAMCFEGFPLTFHKLFCKHQNNGLETLELSIENNGTFRIKHPHFSQRFAVLSRHFYKAL